MENLVVPTLKTEQVAPRVAFHTLGCKLNFSETATITRKVEKEAYKRVAFEEC